MTDKIQEMKDQAMEKVEEVKDQAMEQVDGMKEQSMDQVQGQAGDQVQGQAEEQVEGQAGEQVEGQVIPPPLGQVVNSPEGQVMNCPEDINEQLLEQKEEIKKLQNMVDHVILNLNLSEKISSTLGDTNTSTDENTETSQTETSENSTTVCKNDTDCGSGNKCLDKETENAKCVTLPEFIVEMKNRGQTVREERAALKENDEKKEESPPKPCNDDEMCGPGKKCLDKGKENAKCVTLIEYIGEMKSRG